MEILIPISVVLAAPILYLIVQYNSLIGLRNHIRDAWANIDTELKRRHDLIPNLVATVQGYATHERSLLERLVELRNQCAAHAQSGRVEAREEQQLGQALGRVLALVENYPDLKADQHFLRLQEELVNTEDRIQAARRFYNGNVRDYRNKCESFPSNVVANLFRFESTNFFDIEPVAREVPSARV